MTWTQNTTTHVWTQSGATRSAVIASSAFPGKSAVVLDLVDKDHAVCAVVYASPDGDTRIEAGIVGANVVIQSVIYNAAPTVLTNGAQDVPISSPCSVAHGLTAGVPFTLECRVFGGVIEVWINGVRKLRHQLLDTEDYIVTNPFGRLDRYGFVSSVNGAVVQSANIVALADAEPTAQTEVLVVVCDGNVFLSDNGTTFTKIGSSQFSQSGPVALTEFLAEIYGVDGAFCRTIDPQGLTVGPWLATAGAFPGGGGVAGATAMTIVSTFLGRVSLSGDRTDPQNVWDTAVGDPNDFDTAADASGRAFATTDAAPGKIGKPVTCLVQISKGVQVVGCSTEIWKMGGDPVFGNPDISPLMLGSGISGKDAAALAADGLLIAHSPDGLLMVNADTAVNLSNTVLTSLIQIDRDEIGMYLPQVIRDTRRHLTHIFLTPKSTGAATHITYDERVGKIQPGQGGFFPVQFPDRIGPTASCIFRGEVLLGTREGTILRFDDSVATDDGTAITSKCSLALEDAPNSNNDTLINATTLTLAAESGDVQLRYYGGRTPQEALVGSTRALLAKATVAPYENRVTMGVRSSAISVEIWGTGPYWSLERAEVVMETRRRIAQAPIIDPTPPAPCPPPSIASSSSTDSGGGSVPASVEYLLMANAMVYEAQRRVSYATHLILEKQTNGQQATTRTNSTSDDSVPF